MPAATTKAKTTAPDHVDHATLEHALAAFQAEVPTIAKGNEATVSSQRGSYKYAYADLSDVTEAALPLLGKHGLSFHSSPTLAEHGFVLRYELRHESGGTIEGLYPLPDPRSTAAQQLGSAITYARRYVLCSVTGVAPGGDDDAQAAVPASAPPAQQQRPAPAAAPARDWVADAKAASSTDAVGAIWRQLRAEVQAGRATQDVLDEVAVVGQERAAADNSESTGEPDPAPEAASA